MKKSFLRFLPFWIFLILFKFAACIHFNLMSPYGEMIFPLWFVGLVIGGASLIQLIFDVPAGLILDKYGYRKFLAITVVLFILAAILLLFGLNKFTYLMTLFMASFGWLFFGPGVNAYVLTHASKDNAGRFLSLRDIFESIGVVLSSVLLVLTLSMPTKFVGVLIIIIFVFSLIVLFLSPKDIENVNTEKKVSTHNFYIKRVFLHKIIKSIIGLNPASLILMITGLSSSIFYAIVWFVVPLIIASNKDDVFMGVSLATFDLAVLLLGFVLGKMVDKFNKKLLVFFGLLLFSVTGMLLGFNYGILFVLIGFIATIGDEMASLSLWSWLNVLDKDHDSDGTISGVINLFQDLGWAIGPIIAGILYTKIGPEMTIAVGGGLIFVSWLLYSIKFSGVHVEVDVDWSLIPQKPHKFRHKR